MPKKANKCSCFYQKKWQWVLAKREIGDIIGARRQGAQSSAECRMRSEECGILCFINKKMSNDWLQEVMIFGKLRKSYFVRVSVVEDGRRGLRGARAQQSGAFVLQSSGKACGIPCGRNPGNATASVAERYGRGNFGAFAGGGMRIGIHAVFRTNQTFTQFSKKESRGRRVERTKIFPQTKEFGKQACLAI